MNILKALLKQLLGARYERAGKSLMVCCILYVSIRAAGMEAEIAPSVLFLTAAAVSAGILWQALHSSGNADSMTGLFLLPFADRNMTFSIVLAFTGYTLVTKTFPVLTLFFAVHEWSAAQTAVSLLCACHGCFLAAAWYVMTRKRKQLLLAVPWCAAVLLSLFWVQDLVLLAFIAAASLCLSVFCLSAADAYGFCRPVTARQLIRRTRGTGSVFLYLLRHLMTNRHYLLNTAGLCLTAAVLPFLLGQFEGLPVLPLGFAILCLNTPVCILLSCDPALEQAVRMLPGQARRFCIRYCVFLFSVNTAVSGVYLASWQWQYGSVGGAEIAAALLIALQSAILSVLLEWLCPIRSWKIESDLWHHPRKYIVPVVMLFLAGLIGVWPASQWILLCAVLAEILFLPKIARRL